MNSRGARRDHISMFQNIKNFFEGVKKMIKDQHEAGARRSAEKRGHTQA